MWSLGRFYRVAKKTLWSLLYSSHTHAKLFLQQIDTIVNCYIFTCSASAGQQLMIIVVVLGTKLNYLQRFGILSVYGCPYCFYVPNIGY